MFKLIINRKFVNCKFCWTTRLEEFHYDSVNRPSVKDILVREKG